MSDDDRIVSDDGIIDLAAYRADQDKQDEPPRSFVRASGSTVPDEQIEFCVAVANFDMPTLVCSVATAERLAHLFHRAVRDAWRLTQDRCSVCGEHACRKWHPGRRYVGWRNGQRVFVICEKLCKRSTRLRVMASGEVFYTRSTVSWTPCDRGVLGCV